MCRLSFFPDKISDGGKRRRRRRRRRQRFVPSVSNTEMVGGSFFFHPLPLISLSGSRCKSLPLMSLPNY